MTESLGNKAIKGTIWASIDRFGMMGMQFVVNLVLARLLAPSDFGAIGMIMIFIAISQVFVDGGFGPALIQKKHSDQTDFSTIFFWNCGVGVLLYGVIFFIAPAVGKFYDMPILSPVLRVFGISLVLNSITGIQAIRLQKGLAFKPLAAVNVLSYLIGGITAIVMAFYGNGVWSLVTLTLVSGVVRIILFYMISHWLPNLTFSYTSFKELFGFGGYLLCANLLQNACKNVQGLIIGKKFSASEMGYYSQADKLDQITSYSLPQVIVQVMYPVYAQIQDDRQRLISTMEMNFRVIAFVIFPILATLILVAEPLITMLYGAKWLPAVPYFRILCCGGIFVCLTNINYYAVAAVGKSRSLFMWSFYKWGMLLLFLIAGMNFGMTALMWSIVASHFNIFIVNAMLSRKWVGFPMMTLIKTVAPIGTLSIILTTCIFTLSNYCITIHWGIQIALFFSLYMLLAYIFRFKAVQDTAAILKRLASHTMQRPS